MLVVKRPRHDDIVQVLNKLKVNINYITDGDIAGALSVAGEKPKNDIYYSTGGAPEGVVVAAALSYYVGQIQGRLILNEEEKVRAKKLNNNYKKNIILMIWLRDVIFLLLGFYREIAKGD